MHASHTPFTKFNTEIKCKRAPWSAVIKCHRGDTIVMHAPRLDDRPQTTLVPNICWTHLRLLQFLHGKQEKKSTKIHIVLILEALKFQRGDKSRKVTRKWFPVALLFLRRCTFWCKINYKRSPHGARPWGGRLNDSGWASSALCQTWMSPPPFSLSTTLSRRPPR
jgi:hypothetical protein